MINWGNVSKAIEFYVGRGYHYLEVPWIVSDAAMAVTLPPGHEATRCQDGALVGSAEQSFIHLMLEGRLAPGRYVAATPCFRDDQVDEWHRRYFFKVELIDFDTRPFPEPDVAARAMAGEAELFFLARGAECKVVSTADGYDCELMGVELGSYGYRNYLDYHWIYGTGYAEPRFTQALEKYLATLESKRVRRSSKIFT